MGERRTPPNFETRRAQMLDVTRYLTTEHLNSYWDITSIPVRNAVATVFAADTRIELLQETKQYITDMKLPIDPENLEMAKQLILDINEPKPSTRKIDQMPPRVSLRRYMAKKLARLDHLCEVDRLMHQKLSPIKKQELNEKLFPKKITIEDEITIEEQITLEDRIKFVGLLAAAAVDKVDDFLSMVIPQAKPTDIAIPSRQTPTQHLLFDPSEEL